MKSITLDEFQDRLKKQNVDKNDFALICPICGTVQSMNSLVAHGASKETVENFFGFSCEGRFSNAGAWPSASDKSSKATARRKKRGCDWTLGGLFKLHELEVVTNDGVSHPMFEPASEQEAKDLIELLNSKK